jgi:hypothetical protein
MKQKLIIFKKNPNTLRAFMTVSLCMCLYLISTKSSAQVYYGANQINLHLRSYFGNLLKPVGYPKYNHSMAGHTVDSLYYRAQHNDTIDNSSFFAMQQEMKAMAYDTLNVTNADTTFKYANRFGADTVPLGIMDYNYYRIKPVALSTNAYFNFDTVNDILTDLSVRPGYPYDTYNCCVLSPLVGSINNAKVVYRIDPAFIFADVNNASLYTGAAIIKLDFGDGTGWHTITTNAISYYTANYAGGTGNAVIKWDVLSKQNPDNHKYGSAQMKVGTVTYPEPNTSFSLTGLNIGVYSGCSKVTNPADRKVLIYLEGFDALDMVSSLSRGVSEIYDGQILSSGVDDLRRFGYDIYVVSWQNSRIDIKQNGKNVEGLIRWLRCNHPSQQPYVIMGESMGGLVARYALLDMEKNPDKEGCYTEKGHNTRLLITMDTPHKGANIPMSVQFLYQEVVGLLSPFLGPVNKAILMAGNIGIDGDAAKQMLYYHAGMTIPNATPQLPLPHPMKLAFMNALSALGNYPKYCKTIAMSNGSMAGLNQTNDYNGASRVANDDLLSFNSNTYLNVLGLKIPIINADLQLKTNPSGTAQVYHINAGTFGIKIKLKWWGIKVTIGYGSIIQSNNRFITGGDGICVHSGGVIGGFFKYGSSGAAVASGMQSILGSIFSNYNTLVDNNNGSYDLHSQWTQSGWFGNNAHIASQGLHWNFIPTISALDYNTTNLSYNVEADGFAIPSNNPFNAITGIYTGCNESGAEIFTTDYPYYKNRHHLTVRNDLLTTDGLVNSPGVRAIKYGGDACTANQQVQFLNREIGDDELWLNNYNLKYTARFVPELSLHVEQSPYLNYSGQIPAAQRRGIYTKTNPMVVITPGFAQFNYNPYATPVAGVFTNVYLSSAQYSLTRYPWNICCLSGQRLANTQTSSMVAEANNNSLLMYPNPSAANSMFNIDIIAQEQGNLVITDIVGKILFVKPIIIGANTLSVSKGELNLSAGMYIVSLQLNTNTLTQKLIIN